MNPTSIRFGPAGNSDSFYAAGYKRTADAPAYLQAMGLDALEYSFGRGVRMGQETAQAIREAAQAAGIALSVHLPYFINLAVQEPEKQEKNLQYFRDGLLAARAMGASRAVFHPGSARGDRGEALARACGLLADILAALDQEGLLDTVTLCAETMGKINQLGDLDEVLELCTLDERLIPCIDFGHLYARSCGVQFADATAAADYAALLDTLAARLGDDRAVHFHAHFSRIAYTKGGEKCHLTFADTAFGPPHAPLLALLKERHLAPTIICESAGTQAEDAAALAQGYAAL